MSALKVMQIEGILLDFYLSSDLCSQYISLPPCTSVSRPSKRHAHKVLLNDRFQNSDFVFGQLKPVIILFAHAAKKDTKPCKSRRQRYILKIQIQKENLFLFAYAAKKDTKPRKSRWTKIYIENTNPKRVYNNVGEKFAFHILIIIYKNI